MFDPVGEKAFIEECQDMLRDKTVILITHRPASLALADRTIRLEPHCQAPPLTDPQATIGAIDSKAGGALCR